ncbi:MAG: hypothetical protein V4754_10355 [Pseudomonadota bacterium]
MTSERSDRSLRIALAASKATLFLSAPGLSPMVSVAGRQADSLTGLLALLPELADGAPVGLAALCLHFHGDGQYLLIDQPDAFRQRYAAQFAYEPTNDNAPVTVADFPLYDNAEIAMPTRAGAHLVFYAESFAHGLPFRVQIAWPPSERKAGVDFRLLKVLDESELAFPGADPVDPQ